MECGNIDVATSNRSRREVCCDRRRRVMSTAPDAGNYRASTTHVQDSGAVWDQTATKDHHRDAQLLLTHRLMTSADHVMSPPKRWRLRGGNMTTVIVAVFSRTHRAELLKRRVLKVWKAKTGLTPARLDVPCESEILTPPAPGVFWNLFLKDWKIWRDILHAYLAFKSTPIYKVLFNYHWLWQRYLGHEFFNPQKAHPCVLSAIARENPPMGLTRRWVSGKSI